MINIPHNLSDVFSAPNVGVASIVANGIGGFYSDVKIKEKQTYESLVPDVPIEDGSFIQDHIILKPDAVEITGQIMPTYIAQQNEKFTATASNIVDTLTVFLPQKTTFQLRQIRNNAINIIDTVDSYLSGFHNIFDQFKGDKDDLMQVFNDFIREIIFKKILVDINMPFRTYNDMVITSCVLNTDNEANSLGYELSAKNIIIAKSKLTVNTFKKGVEPVNNGLLETQDVAPEVCNDLLGSACK